MRILSSNRVVWLNLTGSGNETSAHVQQEPRMTLMVCAFTGDPLILRLYGTARVVHRHDPQWGDLLSLFEPLPRARHVFYSFFGTSIKKTVYDLVLAGVKLCWCKGPDAKPLASEWHERNGKTAGIDFHYIYETRAAWWPCDTYVPTVDRFLRGYDLLGGHIPTNGFSAIIDALACDPASVHVTGFDFFTSGLHNVDERWKPGDPTDPIGHRPDLERAWLARNASAYPITFDDRLQELLA